MPIYIVPKRFALRGFTAQECAAKNEALMDREQCFETDTGRAKFGGDNEPYNDRLHSGWGFADLRNLADGDALFYDAALGYFVPGQASYTDEAAQDAIAAMFAAGTHSGITFTYDDANNKISATASGSGAMIHVGTATVAGSAATTISLTGLDLDADEQYVIELSLKNALGSTSNVQLRYNGDITGGTNFDEQRASVSNTSFSGTRANDGLIFQMPANATVNASGRIRKDLDGKASSIWQAREGATTAIVLRIAAHHYRTAGNVTEIDITTAVNGFAVGSYMEVWKVVS